MLFCLTLRQYVDEHRRAGRPASEGEFLSMVEPFSRMFLLRSEIELGKIE